MDSQIQNETEGALAYVAARHEYVYAKASDKNLVHINTPLSCGATAIYVAAEGGYVDQVKEFIKKGADLNIANENGWTPLIVAACHDESEVIETLARCGADLDKTDINNDSAVTIAAWNGCVKTLHVLADHGANLDLPDEDGVTPLCSADLASQTGACAALMCLGADVSQYMSWSSHSGLAPARIVFYNFFDGCEAPMRSDMCSLFSLTKLMCRMPGVISRAQKEKTPPLYDCRKSFEINIANALYRSVSVRECQLLQAVSYPVKHKLFMIACRAYTASLLLDGDRISSTSRAMRYVSLVTLVMNKDMMVETHSLRVTCKSNSCTRRFPVHYGKYRELEANLIESFVAHDSSRFVTTRDMARAVQLLT